MSRRLMKSLEDLSVQYDDTVRNSSSNIVQFQYGDDKLDPVDMEGQAKPVNFERTFTHAEATTWSNKERGLLPWEILETCKELLEGERSRWIRKSEQGKFLDYWDQSDDGIDQHESVRAFLQTIEVFVKRKADELADARVKRGISKGFTKHEAANWKRIEAHINGKTHILQSTMRY